MGMRTGTSTSTTTRAGTGTGTGTGTSKATAVINTMAVHRLVRCVGECGATGAWLEQGR